MAKVSFSKLGLKVNSGVKTINWGDLVIEVKQYLPINEKLELISNVLNACSDDHKFYNMGKFEVFFTLAVVYNYTNINFTEKQKEDVCKLYDLIISTGLYDEILNLINKEEIKFLYETAMEMIKSIYAYENSILGILDTISQDYSNLDFDASALQAKMADQNNLALLRDVLTKLG